MKWRPMEVQDLAAVAKVAEQVHPDYPESDGVFAERLALYPAGCHVLIEDGQIGGDAVRGYAISHPWRAFDAPKLDSLLGALPFRPDTYYLHDISLLPRVRGRKLADAILTELIGEARDAGLGTLSLVAVNDSVEFWMRRGFEIVETPELSSRLASYDGEARFMMKII